MFQNFAGLHCVLRSYSGANFDFPRSSLKQSAILRCIIIPGPQTFLFGADFDFPMYASVRVYAFLRFDFKSIALQDRRTSTVAVSCAAFSVIWKFR